MQKQVFLDYYKNISMREISKRDCFLNFKFANRLFCLIILLLTFPLLIACAEGDPLKDNIIDVIEEGPDNIAIEKDYYKGKRISIIGNSRCTYKGEIPASNRSFYPRGDINDVTKTWWWIVIDSINATLEVNNSYSAGRITNSHPTYPNYQSRIGKLGNPDIIFLWGGVNDQNNGIPVGDINFDLSDEELDSSKFATAFIKLIRSMKTLYANAQIIVFIETDLNAEYTNTLHQIASYYNLKTIDLTHLSTSKMDALHYNSVGMTQIANETIKQLFIN